MDQIKVGKFISELRKEHKLTQAELGEKIGVTNKTISRWENGNYMPDIDMLLILSELFCVTVSELLNGERQSPEQILNSSNNTISEAIKSDRYTVNERTKYWKKKWLKEHIALIVIITVVWLSLFPAAYFLLGEWRRVGGSIIFLIGIFFYAFLHNKKMAYVEGHVTDGIHNTK